jgi:hypothetical protein
MPKTEPAKRIRITKENIKNWPAFEKLQTEGKVIFDNEGRLRYSHGAPVGDMILARVSEDGQGVYKESADEWFDPESQLAESFRWP